MQLWFLLSLAESTAKTLPSQLIPLLVTIWLRIRKPNLLGLLRQLANSPSSRFSERVPAIVSPSSAPTASSTESSLPDERGSEMTVTLSGIASAMAAGAAALTATSSLFSFVGEIMETAEQAYGNSVDAGASKKAAVLAALKALAEILGESWDEIKDKIASWIDVVKKAYTTAKNALAGRSVAA